MIDLTLVATWAKRSALIVLIVLWRWEAWENQRLLEIAQTSVDTTADCVMSYRDAVHRVMSEPLNLHGAGL